MLKLRESYRKGAIGACMDEYERAADDLKGLVKLIPEAEFVKTVDPDTADEDCRSAQTIMSHVVRAAFGYSHRIRTALSIPSALPERELLTRDESMERLDAALRHTIETLDGRWEMTDAEIATVVIKAPWGPTYDAEGMLEHAIVHLLRHRRQLEKFIHQGLLNLNPS